MATNINPTPIDVKNDIPEQLRLIEARLGDTFNAFILLRAINEQGHGNLQLDAAVQKHAGFWQPALLALQTAVFTGIFAVLDKNRNDSATLYSAAKLIRAAHPGVLAADFDTKLDVILNRYATFRHKLFGHNDFDRWGWADSFDAAGMTFSSLHDDLEALVTAIKTLSKVHRGEDVPDDATLKRLKQEIDLVLERTRRDTGSFLSWLTTTAT